MRSKKAIAAVLDKKCSRFPSSCSSTPLQEPKSIHKPMTEMGTQDSIDSSNNLLAVYAKCGKTENARHLFDEMPVRDVVSWTTMISAYTKTQNHDLALELFDRMLGLGVYPNEFTFSSVLRSCAGLGEFGYGARVHAFVIKKGFESNPVLCSGLIGLYSKCGYLEEADALFHGIEKKDTVSWTSMISSLVGAQKWREALEFYGDMVKAGVPPNEFTFVKLLAASACFILAYGRLLHAHIIKWGIKVNVVVKTALVDLYSRFQRMEDAMNVLKSTPEYDVYAWTAVISGFVRNLEVTGAVAAFLEMQVSGVRPNDFTYSTMLSLSSSVLLYDYGKQIHSQVIRTGFEDHVHVGSALVDMYTKCSLNTEDALKVFRRMNSPNIITWTALIAGFVDHGLKQDSFELFEEMLAQGIQPNSVTLSSILRACSHAKFARQILELHGYILRTRADNDIAVGNSLVNAYAGLGMVEDAWNVTNMMDRRDEITYTILVTKLNQMGHHEAALYIISHMCDDAIKFDQYTLTGFLSASANLGTPETGKHLHGYSVKSGLKSGLSSRISVLNALVDLYVRCGSIEDAKRVFEEIAQPDVVSWNALISGLASNGHISSALSAFDDMRLTGTKPDNVTFLLVLSACSNGKLVDLGLEYFRSMKQNHNIEPQIDHYIYLVDLLGQVDRLEDAVEVLQTMPFKPNALILKTLLSACRLHGNLLLGEVLARRGLELDPFDPAFYMLLADLYNDCGKPELAEKTRRLMGERGLTRKGGQSSVAVHGKVHRFIVEDASHAATAKIHEKIGSLLSKFGSIGYAYKDKEGTIYHSAKLAVAFGLLNAQSKAPICVVKNKHLCRDCHNFISLVSRVVNRDIIVRDGKWVHTFKNGACSCNGRT